MGVSSRARKLKAAELKALEKSIADASAPPPNGAGTVQFAIPEPIEMGPLKITAANFVEYLADTNPELSASFAGLSAAMAVRSALLSDDGFARVRRDDLNLVAKVMLSPAKGYIGLVRTWTELVDGKQVQKQEALPIPATEIHRMVSAFIAATAPEEN